MADEIMFLNVTRMSFYPILTINCHRDVFISNFNGAHNVVILPLKLQLHAQGQARGNVFHWVSTNLNVFYQLQ